EGVRRPPCGLGEPIWTGVPALRAASRTSAQAPAGLVELSVREVTDPGRWASAARTLCGFFRMSDMEARKEKANFDEWGECPPEKMADRRRLRDLAGGAHLGRAARYRPLRTRLRHHR